MGVATTRHKQFFMTRQIATILEDLDRQLLMTDSISLLYGVNGVGKTRLLQQFISTRQPNVKMLFVCFSADGTYTCNEKRYSQSDIVNTVLPEIKQHSLLILDQFEHALSDVSRDLLMLWSQVMRHKSKLIICGSHDAMPRLSQITTSLKYPVNSVELKPLSQNERQEYLAALLCPSSDSYAVFNRPIKKLIRHSGGLFRNLDDVYQQYAQDIECKPGKISGSAIDTKKFFIAASILVVLSTVLVFALEWIETDIELANKTPLVLQPSLSAKREGKKVKQLEPATFEETAQTDHLPEAKVQHDSLKTKYSEPRMVNALSESLTVTPELPDIRAERDHLPLQQRMMATQIWLQKANEQTASIQIMTIRSATDTFDSMSLYLQRLSTAGIDLENIYIYSAPGQKARIYGVLFGSYANRREAQKQMAALPVKLKANKPIVRTVKGIKQELMKNRQR